MRFDDTRLYRVKDIAEMWVVHPVTVYRLVESGELPAIRFGKAGGKGALRIRGEVINAYLERAETVTTSADVVACATCGRELVMGQIAHTRVGVSPIGVSVFACVGECAEQARAGNLPTQVAGEVA